MSRRPAFKSHLQEDFRRPFWNEVVRFVVNLPRLARILLCAVLALATTFAVSPLVDYLYLSYMYTPETTVVPSLVSAGAGIVAYFFGWWLIIGPAGDAPPVRPAAFIYLCFGILMLALIIVLSVMGLSSANSTTLV